MTFRISALFLDPRRDFPHKFAELLWPQIQFTAFDRVQNVNDAFQKHLTTEFDICFISDRISEHLNDFFVDIARLGRDRSCIFVRVLAKDSTLKTASELAANSVEPSSLSQYFDLELNEAITKEQLQALEQALGVVWHRMEISRRTSDLAISAAVLMRAIDDAAAARRRGRATPINYGVTSLVRMHTEFDPSLLDEYLQKLSEKFASAKPNVKLLRNIPLPVVSKGLPGLSDEGYLGASNRVFNMLVDRFGEQVDGASAMTEKEASIHDTQEVSPSPAVQDGNLQQQSVDLDCFDWSSLDKPEKSEAN